MLPAQHHHGAKAKRKPPCGGAHACRSLCPKLPRSKSPATQKRTPARPPHSAIAVPSLSMRLAPSIPAMRYPHLDAQCSNDSSGHQLSLTALHSYPGIVSVPRGSTLIPLLRCRHLSTGDRMKRRSIRIGEETCPSRSPAGASTTGFSRRIAWRPARRATPTSYAWCSARASGPIGHPH